MEQPADSRRSSTPRGEVSEARRKWKMVRTLSKAVVHRRGAMYTRQKQQELPKATPLQEQQDQQEQQEQQRQQQQQQQQQQNGSGAPAFTGVLSGVTNVSFDDASVDALVSELNVMPSDDVVASNARMPAGSDLALGAAIARVVALQAKMTKMMEHSARLELGMQETTAEIADLAELMADMQLGKMALHDDKSKDDEA